MRVIEIPANVAALRLRPRGRPRGDAAVLAVLSDETWTLAAVVERRLGLSRTATLVRLWRAQQRGLVEHAWRLGYRRADR